MLSTLQLCFGISPDSRILFWASADSIYVKWSPPDRDCWQCHFWADLKREGYCRTAVTEETIRALNLAVKTEQEAARPQANIGGCVVNTLKDVAERMSELRDMFSFWRVQVGHRTVTVQDIHRTDAVYVSGRLVWRKIVGYDNRGRQRDLGSPEDVVIAIERVAAQQPAMAQIAE